MTQNALKPVPRTIYGTVRAARWEFQQVFRLEILDRKVLRQLQTETLSNIQGRI